MIKIIIGKNKILKVDTIIRMIISVFSIFVALYMSENTDNAGYNYYFLVPLGYGFLILFNKAKFSDFSRPGILMLNYTMLIKYSLMPFISCMGGYYSWLGTFPEKNDINMAIIFTIIEMFAIMVTINILEKKYEKHIDEELQSKNSKEMKHILIHVIMVVLAVLVIVFVPATISDYRFIFNSNNLDVTIKVDFQLSGIFKTIVIFGRYALVLIIINYFYKKNKKKRSTLNIVGAFIPVILNTLYISNLGRIGILVPVLTFSIVIFQIFNTKKERKKIIKMLVVILLTSITFLSMVKFFGKGRGNENRANDIGWWGDTLNMYFSGIKETAIGVKNKKLIDEVYGGNKLGLFFNDILSNVIGLSNFTNNKINSTKLYNFTYFSSSISTSQIVPNIIEGYYYFGSIFSFVWPITFLYFIYYFERKSKLATTIDLKFAYIYASIYCGMVLMINSSMIICNITNVTILFVIISMINNKFIVKNK